MMQQPRHGTARYVRADRKPNPVTSFNHKGNYLTIKIRARKDGKYQIDFPAVLGDSKSRKAITFGSKPPFGLNPKFLQFLMFQLETLVSSWKTFKTAKDWVTAKVQKKGISKRIKWRNGRIKKWSTFRYKNTRSSSSTSQHPPKPRRVKPIVMAVPPLKKVGDIVIAMPGISHFDDMARGCRLKVTTVIPNRGSKHKPRVTVWVPKVFCDPENKQGYRVSMGTNYGASEEWQKYVAEYLQVNARKWNTIGQAKSWLSKKMPQFKRLLNLGYDHHLRENEGRDRVWRIGPSKVPVCQDYIDKEHFPKDCKVGNGLWTEKSGFFDIHYGIETEWTRTTDKSHETLTDQEGAYMVMADPLIPNMIHIPTQEAFDYNTIADAFMVNLVLEKNKPTHINVYDSLKGRAYLKCIRKMNGQPGKPVEASVDYQYPKSLYSKTHLTKTSYDPLKKKKRPPKRKITGQLKNNISDKKRKTRNDKTVVDAASKLSAMKAGPDTFY